jgi:pyroglutamyl-peptidase
MAHDTIVTGLRIAIETTLRTLHDVRETGGQLH